jgi:hypothetical protein
LSGPRASDVILSPSAEQELLRLEASPEKAARSIAKRVRALRAILLRDCLHGELVRKSALPASLVREYTIENLFVEDLPSFWRLLYSVVHEGSDRVVVVIEIVDHRAYDRWFPGRGR